MSKYFYLSSHLSHGTLFITTWDHVSVINLHFMHARALDSTHREHTVIFNQNYINKLFKGKKRFFVIFFTKYKIDARTILVLFSLVLHVSSNLHNTTLCLGGKDFVTLSVTNHFMHFQNFKQL